MCHPGQTGQVSDEEPVTYGGVPFTRAPTRRRGRETVRDMVISMAVVGGGVLALLLVSHRPQPEAGIKEIDWRPAAATARAGAEYPVLAPEGLSAQWRATSARFETMPSSGGRPVWHLGLVTPGNGYAGLEQTDGDAARFVRDVVDGAQPVGESSIAGQTWQQYGPGANGFRSLVLAQPSSTVIITGSAALPELEQLAGALRAG